MYISLDFGKEYPIAKRIGQMAIRTGIGCGFAAATIFLSGCAGNDSLVRRVDYLERSMTTVGNNEHALNASLQRLLSDQARVQAQLNVAVQRLESVLASRQAQAAQIAEIRALVDEAARITNRLAIVRVGDASLLTVKN